MIEKQDVDEMNRLIDTGADVNAKGAYGVPVLAWAYNYGEKGIICLLKHGADPNFIIDRRYSEPLRLNGAGCTLPYDSIAALNVGDDRRNYVDILLK